MGFLSIEVLVLFSGLAILLFVSQSKWVDRKLSNVINAALKRYTYLDVKDYYSLLHLTEDYRVSELKVGEQGWLAKKTLAKMDLPAEGVLVLGIKTEQWEVLRRTGGKNKGQEK